MNRQRIKLVVIGIGVVVLLVAAAPPVLALMRRDLSSIALAKYAYANRCSPLSLFKCADPVADDRTASILSAAVAANPADAETRRNEAYYLILQGRYEQADPELRQVLTQSPADGFAAFALSTVDLRAGRDDEVVAIWSRLGATPLVTDYAGLAMRGHDYPGALSLYQLALAAKPGNKSLQAQLVDAEKAAKPTPTPKPTPKAVP